MWYIYTIEYNWAIKKKTEVLICATVWVDLENMVSKEASHKAPHITIPFMQNVPNKQINQDGKCLHGHQARVGGKEHSRSHASVLFTWVNPMTFKLYFNKAVAKSFLN